MKITNVDLKFMCLDALDDLKSIGIDLTDNIYEFELSNRLKKSCGYCQEIGHNMYSDKAHFKICISAPYAAKVDVDELYDTIIHELLHSAPNCMNHGSNWLRLAEIANANLLTHVKQYYTGDEYDPRKYIVKCVDCDKVVYRRANQTAIYKGIKNGTKKCYCNTCRGYNLIAIEL